MSTTKVVSAAAGLLLLATGLWAFAAPRSFFESVATYPPFNKHLLHDLGLGALPPLLTSTFAALAHWLDRELGGSATDPWYLSAFALVLLAAAAWRWKELRR